MNETTLSFELFACSISVFLGVCHLTMDAMQAFKCRASLYRTDTEQASLRPSSGLVGCAAVAPKNEMHHCPDQ